MTWETAKDFIDITFENAANFHTIPKQDLNPIRHKICWDFIGGEPLLQADLMFKCMEYICNRTEKLDDMHPWKSLWSCGCGQPNCKQPGYRFMVGTNGLLLNDAKIQKELLKYKDIVHIGVTLDGDQEMHDLCRKDTAGKGSFDRVMRAWIWLRQNFPASVHGTKSTIAHENLPYISRIIKFFAKLEPNKFYLMQNCVFENVWHKGDQFTLFNQLCDAADFIIDNKIYDRFMARWFDLSIFKKSTSTTNWCGASTVMTACDHNGDLFSCIRFKHVAKPHILGTLKTGFDSDKRKMMETGNPISSDEQFKVTGLGCKECPISGLCSDCQAFAYETFDRFDLKSPFLCPMHRAVAIANIYFFGKLVQFSTVSDYTFRDYLARLLDDYTKDNYFGFDEQGRKVEWKI